VGVDVVLTDQSKVVGAGFEWFCNKILTNKNPDLSKQ
jgi:hypothetical protein